MLRRPFNLAWSRAASGLALAALLVVLSAPLWHGSEHGHDHDDHDEQEHTCPVCIAVHTPTTGSAGGGALVERLTPAGVVEIASEPEHRVLTYRVGSPRAPPA